MVDSVFELLPNYDNSLDFEWPLGDMPNEPAEDLPTAIQDLLATTLTSRSIKVDGTMPANATHVNIQRSQDNLIWSDVARVTSLPYNSGNLIPNTKYYFRAYAENDAGWGPVSNTTSDTTDAEVIIGDLIFADDFSAYNIGDKLNWVTPPTSLNGAKWWYAQADYEEDMPRIVAGGYGGDAKALGFHFNRRYISYDYAFSEQDFTLCDAANKAVPAIWCEYYVYWPSNYGLARTANDKTFDLLTSQYGKITSTHYGGDYWSDSESWRRPGMQAKAITQNVSSNWNNTRQNWGHAMGDYSAAPYHAWDSGHSFQGSNQFNPPQDGNNDALLFWNQSVDNGQWRQYRFMVKPASAQGVFDSEFRCWKDGVKIAEVIQSDFKDQLIPGFDSGYLFGWQRSGIAENCVVKLSRIKFWSVDQGWT